MSLACSEAELEFHSLKCFLTSYSPSTLFNVHGLQVDLRLLNIVLKDSLYSKHGIDSLAKSLACSEAGLLLGVIQNLICPRTKNTHFLEKIQFVAQGLAQNGC